MGVGGGRGGARHRIVAETLRDNAESIGSGHPVGDELEEVDRGQFGFVAAHAVCELLQGLPAGRGERARPGTRTCTLSEPDLKVMLRPGEKGIRADIMDEKGQLQMQQEPRHTQILQCGSLFRLPRNETHGWWIAHVNNGRGVKGLVAEEIIRQFRESYDDLVIKFTPAVNAAALQEALNRDRLLSVRLFKYDESSDIADRGKWEREDSGRKLELAIKPAKGRLLDPTPLKKFFAGKKTLGQVSEFEGLNFESAKVEVELANGNQRTFNIASPDSGYPMSQDIHPETSPNGDLKDASLFDELRTVIDDL